MMVSRLRLALVLSALAAGAALGTVLAAEYWGGVVPCALCLVQRWPYRIAIILGIGGALLPPVLARSASGLVVLTLLVGAGTGALHVGVEQGFWPSPLPECAAPNMGSGSIADRLARMPEKPSKPCDDPTYLIPALKLSLAGMNMLYALAVAAALATFLWKTRRSAP
jgi:disulfide bond formation protein DsbB